MTRPDEQPTTLHIHPYSPLLKFSLFRPDPTIHKKFSLFTSPDGPLSFRSPFSPSLFLFSCRAKGRYCVFSTLNCCCQVTWDSRTWSIIQRLSILFLWP